MEILIIVTAIANALAAVLAWAAKIWWGREFAAAKDEIIKSKDAQIETLSREINSLRELTPMKIREYFLSVREQLEEYNELLKSRLEEAHQTIKQKEAEIAELRKQGDARAEEIQQLESERRAIAEAAASLKEQLEKLRKKYESKDIIIFQIPKIDTSSLLDISCSYTHLSQVLSKTSDYFLKLSKSISESFSNIYSESFDKLIKIHWESLADRQKLQHSDDDGQETESYEDGESADEENDNS